MTDDEKFERYRNGLDNLIESKPVKLVFIAGAVVATFYFAGLLLMVMAGTVKSFNELRGALNKPK